MTRRCGNYVIAATRRYGGGSRAWRVAAGLGGAETPKRGGTLTYMIPADAPPSFDGHRETTFAMMHSVAPFYSVLIRVNPGEPVLDDRFRLRSLHRDAEADR